MNIFAKVLCLTCLCAACIPQVQARSVSRMSEVQERSSSPEVRAQAKQILAIHEALQAQAGIETALYYSTDNDINAYATEVRGLKVVVLNRGLIELLKDDRDAVAVVIGHELAHHKLDHIRAGQKKKKNARSLGSFLGAVAGMAVGMRTGSSLAADLADSTIDAGTGLLVLKFSRTQEIDADRKSLEWVSAAGFNPQAMLRMQKTMSSLKGKSQQKGSILSTHPSSEKRYKTAKKFLEASSVPKEILDRPVTPLVDPPT